MRALILVAGAALALSACSTINPTRLNNRIDAACELSVLLAQTTGGVATIAQRHGIAADKAQVLAQRAAEGEDVVSIICPVAGTVVTAVTAATAK